MSFKTRFWWRRGVRAKRTGSRLENPCSSETERFFPILNVAGFRNFAPLLSDRVTKNNLNFSIRPGNFPGFTPING